MSGKSPGSIACAAAQVPLMSERSTCRAWRARSACSAATAAEYRRSGLARRSPSRLGGSRTMRRQPPRSRRVATRNTAPHLPKTAREAGWLVAAPLSAPPCLDTRGIHRPDGSTLTPLLDDGTYPRRPCPPHPPVMLVTIAAGPEPRCSSPTELGAVAARCEHCRSRRACHPLAIRDGQRRWPADSHGHSKRAAALAARR
jgi:hypothetical protein